MNSIVFIIPSIIIAGKTLINVYGRISGLQYNFEGDDGGVITLKVGETLNPQITYVYEVNINLDSGDQFGGEQLIGAVLAGVPGSQVYQP